MTTRTVAVVLTGTVTPFQTAMRTAARTTVTTASTIQTSMRAASTRAQADLTRLGARGSATMTVLRTAATTAAATIGTRFPLAASRAQASFAALGRGARTVWATISTGAGRAAAWTAERWSVATTAIGARMARVSATAGRAAGAVSASWAAAGRVMSSAMLSASAAAANAGAIAATAANNGRRSLKAARTASLGLVAAFGLAAYAAANFDKAMSGVKAVTFASARDLASLRQAAIDAGQATQYSATEAATAEAELAKAGVSVKDILGGGLQGTLALAAAGQLDLADAAVVSAKAMNAFGLSGKDVGHVADVLAAGAGKSATDVHELGMALTQSALLAHQTGLSLEDTAGALSLFAQNGLAGSDAGTSLKTMLMRLTPQSSEAAAMMDKLGFSAYDSSGNFVGLSETAGRMQKAFGNLTPEARNSAFATIFGSDATRAATVIYGAGTTGINKWTKAVNDQGYASKVASTQTDNLVGDLERLKGSLETALIQSGSSANGVLRGMAKILTGVVNWYSKLPTGVQQSVTAMAGLLGIVGLVATSLLLFIPRIRTVRTELTAMGLTAERTRGMMAGLGKLSAVIGALAALSYASDALQQSMKGAQPSVTQLSSSIVQFGRDGQASGALAKQYGGDLSGLTDAMKVLSKGAADNGAVQFLDKLSTGFGLFGDGTLDTAKQEISGFDEALASLASSGYADSAAQGFKQLTAAAEKQGISAAQVKDLLPQYADALTQAGMAGASAAGGQKQFGDAAATTADEVADQRTQVEKLTDALDGLNGGAIDSATAQISFRQSLADLSKAAKENGHSLDTNTTKGRAVKSAFLDAAKSAQSYAEAVAKQKDSQAEGEKTLNSSIAALKRQMKQAGFTEQQIKNLIGAYAQMPTTVTTKVTAKTGQALNDLDAVQKKVAATKGKSITMKTLSGAAEKALKTLGFKVTHMPNGTVRISIPTAGPKAAARSIQSYINSLHGTIPVQIYYKAGKVPGAGTVLSPQANGGTVDYYADGGMRENHVAQIAPAGSYRVWGERETGGESYIPLAPGKRARSRAIADYTVKRLGGKGVAWYAGGGINSFASGGFTYAPTATSDTLGVGAGMDRYTTALGKLTDAVSRLNSATTKAEKNAANKAIRAADATLGLKAGTKTTAFNLNSYKKFLSQATSANTKWENSLSKIGKKAGSDVEDTLRGMGADGAALVNALATASNSTFNSIVNNLKKLAPTAAATLKDYTSQLKSATNTSKAFQDNLLKLASMGYGDLATQLAAQGDDTAETIAAAAVKNGSAAASANAAAKANAALLTSDDITNAVTLIGVLKGKPGAGIADVIAAGLDWSTIAALAPKIASQIKAVPGSSAFVTQMKGQGIAMAKGGILTSPTVLAGERGPEAYIPLNGSMRSRGLLQSVARMSGYDLVPAGRYGGGSSGQATVRQGDRNNVINLHGAKQSSGEQVADVMRHMVALA